MAKHSYPRVTIRWADHFIHNGDYAKEDIKDLLSKPFIGEYTGYLVFQNKRIIGIASNIWDDESVSDLMGIMKKAIIKIEYID